MTLSGLSRIGVFVFAASAILGTVAPRATKREVYRDGPHKYNYRYERSGEVIKPAEAEKPYTRDYEIEESEYKPPEYSAEETANFGAYDLGGGGQFIGGGYSDGLGLGFSNVGYSAPGIGFGVGYSGVGNTYLSQPGFYSAGLGGGYVQRPYITGGNGGYAGLSGGAVGGGYVDKKDYEAAKKNAGGENVEKIEGKAGGQSNQGSQGYEQGAAAKSNAKGDSGYYKDESANKKEAEDGKSYQGAQVFDKSGKEGKSQNAVKSHKKGHSSKGFKTTHRKDEEEKTETFYDEAHDEADHKNFGQNQGTFGEKSAAEFKGGHENESKDAKAQGKEGHYNSQVKEEDSKSKKGEFEQKAYKGNNEEFLKKNGLGEQSILGHQESSAQFYKNKPYGILPIVGDRK